MNDLPTIDVSRPAIERRLKDLRELAVEFHDLRDDENHQIITDAVLTIRALAWPNFEKPEIPLDDGDLRLLIKFAKPFHEAGDKTLICGYRVAEVMAIAAELLRTRHALRTAAGQFRFYEKQHRAKSTAEATAKAEVNKDMAALCVEAIGG